MKTVLHGVLAIGLTLGLGQSKASTAEPNADQLKSARILTAGFLRYHPDIKHRLEGLAKLEDGQPIEALAEFRSAARFGDKVSQAMVAELLWSGAAETVDRAAAYAWMDLAAERGYQVFVAKRERYWTALDAAERKRALQVGQQVYAEYGDDVAKPRLETVLKRGRWAMTGSRVGFKGALEIQVPGPGGQWVSISGEEFYDDKLWKPEQYFAWQDRTWGGPPVGTVTVGEIDTQEQRDAKQ
jgi:hypothetical protein